VLEGGRETVLPDEWEATAEWTGVSLSIDEYRRDVVLLIDHSGSMESTDPTGVRFAAVELLGAILGDCDRVELAVFNGTVDRLVDGPVLTSWGSLDFTVSSLRAYSQSNSAGNTREARSYTNILGALQWAKAQLDTTAEAGTLQHIIILTDGEMDLDNQPGHLEQDLEALAAARALVQTPGFRNISVHAVGFSTGLGGEGSDARKFLRDISTNNELYYSSDSERLLLAFQDCLGDVRFDDIPMRPVDGWSEFPVDHSITNLRLIIPGNRPYPGLSRYDDRVDEWVEVSVESSADIQGLTTVENPVAGHYRAPPGSELGFDGIHFILQCNDPGTVEQGIYVNFTAGIVICEESGRTRIWSGEEIENLGSLDVYLVMQTGETESEVHFAHSETGEFRLAINFEEPGRVTCYGRLTDGEYIERVSIPIVFEVVPPSESFTLEPSEVLAGRDVEVNVIPREPGSQHEYAVRLAGPDGTVLLEKDLASSGDAFRADFTPIQSGPHEVRLYRYVDDTEVDVSEANRGRELDVLPVGMRFIEPRRGRTAINIGTYLEPEAYSEAAGLKRWWSEITVLLGFARAPDSYVIPVEMELTRGAIETLETSPLESADSYQSEIQNMQVSAEGASEVRSFGFVIQATSGPWESGRYRWVVSTDNEAMEPLTLQISMVQRTGWSLLMLPLIFILIVILLISLVKLANRPLYKGYTARTKGPNGEEEVFVEPVYRIELGSELAIVKRSPSFKSFQRVWLDGYTGEPIILECVVKGRSRLKFEKGQEIAYRHDDEATWEKITRPVTIETSGLQLKTLDWEIHLNKKDPLL